MALLAEAFLFTTVTALQAAVEFFSERSRIASIRAPHVNCRAFGAEISALVSRATAVWKAPQVRLRMTSTSISSVPVLRARWEEAWTSPFLTMRTLKPRIRAFVRLRFVSRRTQLTRSILVLVGVDGQLLFPE